LGFSIDVDMAFPQTEIDNAGMMSGSLCGDSIALGDLASCLTFCVEDGLSSDNLECERGICSPQFPLLLPSPTMTASPWETPASHSLWLPDATDIYAPALCMPLSESMVCAGMMEFQDNNSLLKFAPCQASRAVSLSSVADQFHHISPTSPALTASPLWTPGPVDPVPWEEPKTVLRLVDLL